MRNRLTNRIVSKQFANLRREIPDDFRYDKKKLKHIYHILHNVNVALGTLGSALAEFSRVKGPTISPDGLLGGTGYIMPIKTIKEILVNSVHKLGEVADSLADELTNPYWKAEDDKEVKEVLKEKEKVDEKTQEILEEPGSKELKESESEEISPDDVKTGDDRDIIKASVDLDKVFSNRIREALVYFKKENLT